MTEMKRFTDTEKWSDPWFRKLSPTMKSFWVFICDKCDNAGVWKVDMEAAAFFIGEQVAESDALFALGERVEKLSPEKWWIVKFIAFQFGELSPECKPHKSVLDLLTTHSIPYPKGIQTPQEKEKEKDKEQEKDRGGAGENCQPCELFIPPEPTITADDIYAAYPRKVGKPDALRAITKAMKRFSPEAILSATKDLAELRRGTLDCVPSVPNPSTWFNQDRFNDDPETWKPNANNQKPNQLGFDRVARTCNTDYTKQLTAHLASEAEAESMAEFQNSQRPAVDAGAGCGNGVAE